MADRYNIDDHVDALDDWFDPDEVDTERRVEAARRHAKRTPHPRDDIAA